MYMTIVPKRISELITIPSSSIVGSEHILIQQGPNTLKTTISDLSVVFNVGVGLAVTNDHLSDMPSNTIKGNVSGSIHYPSDLTSTQVTSILDLVTTSSKGVMSAGDKIKLDQLTTGSIPLNQLTVVQYVGDSDSVISSSTRNILLTGSLSNIRTYTLPDATMYPAGSDIYFSDIANSINSTNYVILSSSVGNTINGSVSYTIKTTGATPSIVTDGISKWNFDIIGISRGGTGATSSIGARSNLQLTDASIGDAGGLITGKVSPYRLENTFNVGDINTIIPSGTKDVLLTQSLSASRIYTIPSASVYPTGFHLSFIDIVNTVSSTYPVILQTSGNDLINGLTYITISTQGASPMLITDGISRWNLDIRGVTRGGTGAITAAGALANLGAVGNGGNVSSIVALSQTAYNNLSPIATTLYIITS